MNLQPRKTAGSQISRQGETWRLAIPGGNADSYRLAQLDDYGHLPRSKFLHTDSTALTLSCRISEPNLPGTWGFGFWNDPFTVSLGLGGMSRRLPALPNACWFFHASAENHLSFAPKVRPSPASGFLAQAFCAPRIPSLLLAPGAIFAPLLFMRPISRILRGIFGQIIREDAKSLDVDVTQWHEYRLQGGQNRVEYFIDGVKVHETGFQPRGPLGLVIWIDNQFAAWRPDGRLDAGVRPNLPAWMEILVKL